MDLSFPKLTAVDLFCGAGGLSLGFVDSGFEIVRAFDNNKPAILTHNRNLGDHAQLIDLSKENPSIPRASVIMGGPPCQGFSSAGMRRSDDHRNSLVFTFASLIAEARPLAFVFENVEGFLTAEGGARVVDLLLPLLRAGYHIHLRKINAANYGVPQHRKRVIAIGGLGWSPLFPEPCFTAFGAPGALSATRRLPLAPSVSDALKGLGAAAIDPPGDPQGHYCAPLRGIDLDRAKSLSVGQTMFDLPEELQHRSFKRRAFRRVMDGTPSERRGGAPAGLRRLEPGQPSKAITAAARSEFLHPTEDRNLTIRECARLQTFPDSFEFLGSAGEQAQMIGNAVPPRLGRVLAECLRPHLDSRREVMGTGRLLSFSPTASEGYSPALKQVVGLVKEEFSSFMNNEQPFLWP